MLKMLGLVIAGLIVGLIVSTFALRTDTAVQDRGPSFPARSDNGSDEQLAVLRAELRRANQRVAELTSELEAMQAIGSSTAGAATREVASTRTAPPELVIESMEKAVRVNRMATRIDELRRLMSENESLPTTAAERDTAIAQRDTERLLAAGFAPERIDWINRRSDELRVEVAQGQYEAHLRGEAPGPGAVLPALMVENGLRAEMGDAEFERYMRALGKPTAVGVHGMLSGSPAAEAGLQVGDEIVAYDGARVFNRTEVRELSRQGTPGEYVTIDVRRDGQMIQVVMPRGPLGIEGDVMEDVLRLAGPGSRFQ